MRTAGKVMTLTTVTLVGILAVSPDAHAKSVRVTNNADAGAGSFRQAVVDANGDSSITVIKFNNNIGTIELASTVNYIGEQSLSINGRGAPSMHAASQTLRPRRIEAA